MIFCTQCGHKNVADASFCEECGTALVKRSAAPVAETPTPASTPAPLVAPVASVAPVADGPVTARPVNGKLLKFAAIGVAALVAIGGGVVFLLAPESPSNERFAAAIERSLAANAQQYKPHYCLNNFAYNLDPVLVNEQDQNTRQWLALLTQAGLYNEPELIEDGSGYFMVRRLKYTKTEAGNKATQERQLCIADGVTVAKVESFTPPQKVGDTQASRATVTLKLRNPMAWVMSPETRAQAPQIKPEFSDSVVMVLKDGKWDVADPRALQTAMAAERKLGAQQKQNESAQGSGANGVGGIFDSLKKLFHFGASNPIIGRWKSEMMGITVAAFEFDSDSMVTNGQKVNVRYEVEDKRVTVYPQGQGSGMVVNVIDNDTLTIETGLVNVKLQRSN
jgi:hypothetical protein